MDDPAETYTKSDGKPAVELSFRFELDWGPGYLGDTDSVTHPYLLCGHMDRVVSFNDQLFVMDHKSTTTPTIPSKPASPTSSAAAANLLKPSSKPTGKGHS